KRRMQSLMSQRLSCSTELWRVTAKGRHSLDRGHTSRERACEKSNPIVAAEVTRLKFLRKRRPPEKIRASLPRLLRVSGVAADRSEPGFIRESKLFPYASQLATFRCPADSSQNRGLPRVRSYSMNGWMGSRYMQTEPNQRAFRTFVRDNEIAAAGPARLWTLI